MNKTEDLAQLNEMMKRVDNLVSKLPETDQIAFKAMIDAQPGNVENLNAIETIVKNNIQDMATDHDYDDYIPDTFAETKADNSVPLKKEVKPEHTIITDLDRKAEVEKLYSSLDESRFENVIKRIKEEIAIRDKYKFGELLISDTKDNDLKTISGNFLKAYMDDRNSRRNETHNDCYQVLKSLDISAGDKSRDIIWYLYKREEDNFRALKEEERAIAVRDVNPVKKLDDIIEEHELLKIQKKQVNSQKLMGLNDIRNLSKKLKSIEDGKEKITSKTDADFENMERKFNDYQAPVSGLENKFGLSKMISDERVRTLFNYDLAFTKKHPNLNQRYYIFNDGSMAKETLDSFQIKTTDIRKNIDTIISVAKEKGWKKIEIDGGKSYLESVYLLARNEGLHVKPKNDSQRYLFEQLDKKYKLNQQKESAVDDESLTVKNAEEELEITNASGKKNKP